MTTKSFHREVGLINVKTKPFVIQVFKLTSIILFLVIVLITIIKKGLSPKTKCLTNI